MPEIGEVARIVHFLRRHLIGRSIRNVLTQEDDIVYGKVGTSASAFKAALTGKKVIDARQQGKYFWLVLSSPPHPLMHFGMSGWMKFSNDDTAYYKPVSKEEEPDWPPRFWKFVLEMDGDSECKAAFVDARRLGRIRLIDGPGEELRKMSPLKENGPDPVIDKDIVTVDWLGQKLRSKRVPVKALLLDQANLSGVGNWVADEVLYQARLHPEQYSNTFSDSQVADLHAALMHVCGIACSTLADSSKFPENFLMKHRWGKGKKNGSKLPNGDKIVFLKVGGRTSAVVPSVQKKTGKVAGDLATPDEKEESDGTSDGALEEEDTKPAKGRRGAARKTKAQTADEVPEVNGTKSERRSRTSRVKKEDTNGVKVENGEHVEEATEAPKPTKRNTKRKTPEPKEEPADEETVETKPPPKKSKKAADKTPSKKAGRKAAAPKVVQEPEGGRRRSLRNK
ncbi:formamidopyrimidine-DNA glycosylase [Phyllosticta capitalensis]|uniref:formamidopyrimidine-DNA glycosylase n=1 Tax=Phyllosticta capitalensis TaxID=121624 RepID=UPI003130B90C